MPPDEGLVPFPRRSFWGYRLLQEYFAFPEKFCFLDLSGFERVRAADFGDRVEVLFYLSEFERSDRRQMLELGVSRRARSGWVARRWSICSSRWPSRF